MSKAPTTYLDELEAPEPEAASAPSALDLVDAPGATPVRVRTASGAEVIVEPERNLLHIHVGEGLAQLEIELTPQGAIVRTTGPQLTISAPERLRLETGHLQVAAREADIVTQGDLRLRGARIFLN